jgi:hypothetical protein
MVFDGYLIEPEFRKYRLADNSSILVGKFMRSKDGYNEFYPEDGSDPVLISERNSAHALTDDIVRVALFARRRGRGREGEVVEIIKRTHDTFVGELQVEKHYAFLITENRMMPNDIFIPKDLLKGGKSGDKAVVKLLEWPLESKNPVGKVLDVLAPYGRMGLTNYVSQSIIGACLFAMWGLGSTFRAWGYAELMIVGLGLYISQIIISTIWLRYFKYGPLEWLWRSATYLKWQPFKK